MQLEQILFNEAYDAFAGNMEEIPYKVFEYLDEKNQKAVNLLTCFDTPFEHVNSYATIGFSQLPAKLTSGGKPLTVEFVSACESTYDLFPNVVSTCAFQLMDGETMYGPGAVVPNVISMYYPELEMKHMCMAYPFLWEHSPRTLSIGEKLVAWLQLIPISDMEYRYLLQNGYDALENLFEKEGIDVLDLGRKSVINR